MRRFFFADCYVATPLQDGTVVACIHKRRQQRCHIDYHTRRHRLLPLTKPPPPPHTRTHLEVKDDARGCHRLLHLTAGIETLKCVLLRIPAPVPETQEKCRPLERLRNGGRCMHLRPSPAYLSILAFAFVIHRWTCISVVNSHQPPPLGFTPASATEALDRQLTLSVSGASVTRGTSLITLPLLPPSRVTRGTSLITLALLPPSGGEEGKGNQGCSSS